MLSLITVPTDLLASVSTTSGEVFTSLLPIAEIVVGIALGVFFVSWGMRKLSKRGR